MKPIDNAIRSFINPGDEVLIRNHPLSAIRRLPSWQVVRLSHCHSGRGSFLRYAGALARGELPATKLLVLPFPNNPTGAIMTRSRTGSHCRVLRETNILVLSDEIYCDLTYQGEPLVLRQLMECGNARLSSMGFPNLCYDRLAAWLGNGTKRTGCSHL